VTRIAKFAPGLVLACSLFSVLPQQARADASATDKCHAKVVAVASDQLSMDVRLLPPSDPNSDDCKLAGVKKTDTAKADTTKAQTLTTSESGCKPSVDAPCDDITHLVVTDNLVKEQLKQLHKGDRIQIVYYSEAKKPVAVTTPVEQKKAADTTTVKKSPDNKPLKDAQVKKDAKANNDANTKDVKTNDDANANKDTGSTDPDKAKDNAEKSTDTKNSADAKTQFVLKAWCVDFVSPSAWEIIVVLLASAAACFLLTLLFSQWDPKQLIISEDDRYSNSRFQMALWFFVLIVTYIAALLIRVWQLDWTFIGGVDIPKNLLLLSGMSALTFAGAKGITTSKLAAAGTAAQPNPAIAKAQATDGPNFFRDLTHNDGIPAMPAQDAVLGPPPAAGMAPVVVRPAIPAKDAVPPQFDFGDFQMVIITLIAVATYIVLVFNFFGHVEYSKIVSLPDVDTTLLATFGLGQGAYLTKKAVGNVGTS
jgi:hypothetical protein